MKETFSVFATILAVVGYVPYLRDAILKRVKPHPYTWLLWSIVSGITLTGQFVKGGGPGTLPTLFAEILTVTIFIYSLRYGFKEIKKSDTVLLILALLGLIPWFIFKDPTSSVIIAVTIDLIGFIPTYRKTWENPKSETRLLYACNVIRHMFTLIAIRHYNVATVLHSIAMIITNTGMTMIITFKGRKRTNTNK